MTKWSHLKGGLIVPNSTFFNLSDEKRKLITSSALAEFSSASYSIASINHICKRSGIAKGSFYQYFEDKLDLYVYIMTLAIDAKIQFFTIVLDQFQTLSLLEQIRLLFVKGIEFTKINPIYAALGDQFTKETDDVVKSAVLKEAEQQSESFFIQLIEQAKLKGEIDHSVDSTALSLLLQSVNMTVNDYMMKKFGDISYERYEKDVNELVDSLLGIIYRGISNKAKTI